VVLDEATAHLEGETAGAIADGIELAIERTTLLIAHDSQLVPRPDGIAEISERMPDLDGDLSGPGDRSKGRRSFHDRRDQREAGLAFVRDQHAWVLDAARVELRSTAVLQDG